MTTIPTLSRTNGETPPGSADAVIAALDRIERRLTAIEEVTAAVRPLAGLLGTAPGAVAMAADSLDALAARMHEAGIDLDARVRSVARAVEVATAPRAVNGLASLVESRLLEPSALAVLSQLASALADPGPAEPVGPLGALRALREPDVRRALGFLLAVARHFGRHLAGGELDEARQQLEHAAHAALPEVP